MKKKFLFISIIIFVLLIVLYIIGYKINVPKPPKQNRLEGGFKLDMLVERIKMTDNYLLTANYYELDTKVDNKKIIISFKNDEHHGKLQGVLSGDVLSFKIKEEDKNALLKANLIYSVVDSLGQINGNDKGYVSAMLSDYALEQATIDNDGFELVNKNNTNIYRFKVNKKFNLGSLKGNYYESSDLEKIKNKFLDESYIQENKGNLILYKETDYQKNNILYLAEIDSLSKRTYNSLVNIIGLVYGEEYKTQFINAYPELISGQILDKFDIIVDYQAADNEMIKKLTTDNYKIMKIVYKS